ncbi:MAG: hypothetical protein KKB82_03620 [Candidatus Omnitrophica bacterium]|nr:hypothetical protein [Candidatus Omnitrophota bacterium]MBU1924995.1 hypothetical protein [Candidatus Omnitrophota bacterium]
MPGKNCRRLISTVCVFSLALIINNFLCFGQGAQNINNKAISVEPPELAGEIFDVPVPLGNYYFAKKVVMTYSASWRGTPQNEEELEDLTWQELLFSFEAYRREIKAEEEEIDTEIDKTLKASKVDFRWRVDKEKFGEGAKNTVGVPVEIFRNHIGHLVQLEKLRKEIINSFEPEVTDEAAHQKFRDEYNTLSVELVQFDELEQAQAFYGEAIKPVSEEGLDKLIWQDLIFSYEAFKRKIEVTEEDTDKAIMMLLREHKQYFKWKEDEEKFKSWVEENIAIGIEDLKKRMTQLAKIDTLIQKIHKGEKVKVDEDAYQKLLEEEGSIDQAYGKFIETDSFPVQDVFHFGSLKDAREFYKKIGRQAGPWEDKKRKDPELFKRPGFVALDFLINMWGFKKEDAYKMLDEKIGAFYPPASIYKGYGVFKILEIRPAQDAEFEKRKEYYFQRVKDIKKYEAYRAWVENFKKEADIKIFVK